MWVSLNFSFKKTFSFKCADYDVRYSPKSVKLIIEHLYKPKSSLENDVDLVELMVLSDMLGLLSLLTLIIKAITSKLCHNFHKVNNFLSIFLSLLSICGKVIIISFLAMCRMYSRCYRYVAASMHLQFN